MMYKRPEIDEMASSLGVNYPTASCGALREREPPHSKLRTGPLSSPQQAEGYSAEILIIKSKVLEADIRDLAWLWEMTMGDMDLRNPLGALDVLNAIARAYIRGRNCRMGSYQTLWKHLPTKAAMIYHLTRYVSEENVSEPAYSRFPHLRACGVTSVDEFLDQVNKFSIERNRRQEEEAMRKAEEAKKTGRQKVSDIIQNSRTERQTKCGIPDEIRRFVDDDERG